MLLLSDLVVHSALSVGSAVQTSVCFPLQVVATMNAVQNEMCQQLTWNSCVEIGFLFCSDVSSYLLPI